MADREKVIEGLEICIKNINQVDCPNDCPYYSDCAKYAYRYVFQPLLRDALALLKRQEAKPVIVTTNAYGTRFYHCPRCNHDLYIYPRQLYCSNCGQAVKWNDDINMP